MFKFGDLIIGNEKNTYSLTNKTNICVVLNSTRPDLVSSGIMVVAVAASTNKRKIKNLVEDKFWYNTVVDVDKFKLVNMEDFEYDVKFKPGDLIIGNKGIRRKYSITTEHTICRVICDFSLEEGANRTCVLISHVYDGHHRFDDALHYLIRAPLESNILFINPEDFELCKESDMPFINAKGISIKELKQWPEKS